MLTGQHGFRKPETDVSPVNSLTGC